MVGTFATSEAIIAKAGTGVSSDMVTSWTVTSEFEGWIEEAEAVVSTVSRYDYVANSAGLQTNIKPIVTDAVSNIAAINAVKYNMAGYLSRIVAEDVINVCRDAALRDIGLLRDQKGVRFVKDGA